MRLKWKTRKTHSDEEVERVAKARFAIAAADGDEVVAAVLQAHDEDVVDHVAPRGQRGRSVSLRGDQRRERDRDALARQQHPARRLHLQPGLAQALVLRLGHEVKLH